MNLKYLFMLSVGLAFSGVSVFSQNVDNQGAEDEFGNVYSKFVDYDSLDDIDYSNINVGTEQNYRKILSDDFKYKFYIQLGGGGQTIWGADDQKQKFTKRLTISPYLGFGYRFNNKFGVKLSFTGGTVHGFNDGESGTYRLWKKKGEAYMQDFADQYLIPNGWSTSYPLSSVNRVDPYWIDKGWTFGGTNNGGSDMNNFYYTDKIPGFIWGGFNAPGDNFYMRSTRYVAADLSGTMNLTNLIKSGDDESFFDATLFAGPTVFHTFSNQGNLAWTGFAFHTGLDLQLNVSDRVGILGHFNIQWMPDGFNGQYGGNVFQPITHANIGLTYKLPFTEHYSLVQAPAVEEYDPYLEEIRARLESELDGIKDLQSEIDAIRARLAKLLEVDETRPESFLLPEFCTFIIGKSNIRPEDREIIAEVADYLKQNPEASVIVTGFADRDTGTTQINQRLSRERSIAVADALTEVYRINPDRVAIDWKGDEVQPFVQNDLNRAVLFYIDYAN